MQTVTSGKNRTFLKVICVTLAIVLMIGIAAVVALLVYENSEVKVENGLSAYELAVQSGYEGSLQQWLESLNGKSAYEIAKESGYAGTKAEWAAVLSKISESDVQNIESASFNNKGELIITLSDQTTINAGKAISASGKNGKDGADGKNGKMEQTALTALALQMQT